MPGRPDRGQVDSGQVDSNQRVEQRAWCWYDWANSIFQTSIVTVFLALYLTEIAVNAARSDLERNGPTPCPDDNSLLHCDVSLLGLTFPAGSAWGYLVSVATLVQVLVLPITGAIADRTQNKRAMLALFAFTGAVMTALLALVAGTNWQLAVPFFIVANMSFGASIVVYYAYLPEIASPDERDAVSSRGWAFGYLGGGVGLAAQLVIFLGHEAMGLSSGDAVRLCFVIAGLWWAGFTLIPLRRLRRHRPPQGHEQGAAVLTAGFRQLWATLREARAVPLTLAYLGGYLVFADGINTVVQVSAQYGDQELRLPRETLIVTILIVQFVAFGGALLHGAIARQVGAKLTILGSLLVWIVVLAAAYFVQAGQQLQFYALAVGIGLVLGGTNALSRSLFSQMVPPGREGAYFSLYEVGERSTSWLGPLLFAGIGQVTGSFRLAILSLVAFFLIGFVIVALVPVRRAIRAAGNPEPAVV
ncbi:MAG: MFS transporter [Actinomycetota bacterium]|nr:MFS transporter [Actinomycetota bacterium]